jgi:two-component sensor histidine kinase
VLLPASHAVTMALILHELATNAVKHGALLHTAGRVDIQWRLTGEDEMHFAWIETGGPPITSRPEQSGFGTRLIEMSVLQLNGQVERDFAPTGLRVTMRFALPRRGAVEPSDKVQELAAGA